MQPMHPMHRGQSTDAPLTAAELVAPAQKTDGSRPGNNVSMRVGNKSGHPSPTLLPRWTAEIQSHIRCSLGKPSALSQAAAAAAAQLYARRMEMERG